MTPDLETSGDGASAPLYPIGSVGNALKVLLMFKDEPTIRVAQVARELNVARSTAHRLLAMLEHGKFVAQDGVTKAYQAGPVLLDIGLASLAKLDLRTVARPHLEALRAETQESCALLVAEGNDVVIRDYLEGTRTLRVVEQVGDRSPAHLTAGGKAMLAELTTEELRRRYPQPTLAAKTPHSITSREDLESTLAETRRVGYATNLEESGEGYVGIGAAILHHSGAVVGAISLGLPMSRLKDDLGVVYGETIVRAARQIGADLP
jgi:IclR family acetate operon transcriptional repressor